MVLVRRMGLGLAAPLLALVIAAVFASLLLLSAGDDRRRFWETLFTAPKPTATSSTS